MAELIVEALRSAGSRYRASLATSGVKPGIARLKRRFIERLKDTNNQVPSWKYYLEYWAASTRSDWSRPSEAAPSSASRAARASPWSNRPWT